MSTNLIAKKIKILDYKSATLAHNIGFNLRFKENNLNLFVVIQNIQHNKQFIRISFRKYKLIILENTAQCNLLPDYLFHSEAG